MSKKIKITFFLIIFSLIFLMGQVYAASFAYLRSTTGPPWSQNTNEQAMDLAFGAGNWDDLRFETVNTGSLFSAGYQFIFMEGGDDNANEMETFLGSNSAAISSWVNAGGSVFMNAAPNEGNGMDFGFGVSLNYPDFASNVTAFDSGHPIFNGVTNVYSGNAYAHATVSGAGLTGLIHETGDVTDLVLAEMAIGNGFGLFGGMTTTNWHSPNPDALNLRANMLTYASELGQTPELPIPEPATMLLFGFGLLGLARVNRKK